MATETLTSITTSNAQIEAAITAGGRKGAIVCHPWGKLGGCMDDRVVVSVRNELVRAGFTVCRFNFRGVGRSTGWSGLTGNPERDDLRAVCQFLLVGATIGGVRIEPVEELILVGYSFGSVITGSVLDEVDAVKGACAISYPCSVTWALCLWNGSSFWKVFQLSTKPKLLVYGDHDNFSSKSQLDKAATQLSQPAESECFPGVDHFWGGATRQLAERVARWACSVTPPK